MPSPRNAGSLENTAISRPQSGPEENQESAALAHLDLETCPGFAVDRYGLKTCALKGKPTSRECTSVVYIRQASTSSRTRVAKRIVVWFSRRTISTPAAHGLDAQVGRRHLAALQPAHGDRVPVVADDQVGVFRGGFGGDISADCTLLVQRIE